MMDQNKTPLLDAIREFIHTKPAYLGYRDIDYRRESAADGLIR